MNPYIQYMYSELQLSLVKSSSNFQTHSEKGVCDDQV